MRRGQRGDRGTGPDDGVKVIVFTGAGDIFSAGFDLKEFAGLSDPETATSVVPWRASWR